MPKTYFEIMFQKAYFTDEISQKNYAKNLVLTTDMTIPEIASAAGFSDYNYFLRLFKQKYSMSTKQMRKEAQI